MGAIITSRVVAEFYRGIDFPEGWDAGDAAITVAMARDRIMSAIVLLDANTKPLAACWQVEGQNERFVRIRFDDGEEDDLLDDLDDDLRGQSVKLGDPNLLATLLWEPTELRSDQATYVRKEVLLRGRYSQLVWNLSTREILSKASDLLLVTRQASDGLALPVPNGPEEMHADVGEAATEDFLVLPVDPSAPRSPNHESATRKTFAWVVLLLLAALVIGALATNLIGVNF